MAKVVLEDIIKAGQTLKGVINKTPLHRHDLLSEKYQCNIFLKREDLQVVRSFKLRGAYNMVQSIPQERLSSGVVCASAGNHAQGVAYSCKALGIKGSIYVPSTTPKQKISSIKRFGGEFVEVIQTGDTFDDAFNQAKAHCEEANKTFVHPFDDPLVIAGQGTIGMEILNDLEVPADFVLGGVGGGGLMSGVGIAMKSLSPNTQVIGVEAAGAASMKEALQRREVVTLDKIDSFVDGTAVKRVGDFTFDICQEVLDDVIVVTEGKVCTTILEMYNDSAIVVEPAGALPIAALDAYQDKIKGKNVVCIISGGNNDIERTPEIKERSLLDQGLKHYFIVNFPQRPGALKEFVVDVLGPHDDIARFEYIKSNNKEKGPTLIGIELTHKEDYQSLVENMNKKGFQYTEINDNPELFGLLI
ncbi:L-threonine ammonia-lyase [Desulfitobacterium dichloroeliminans LMG P-21439]|uniref:L-threonine dehydratase n=1 Tax=Desulfitobacterium dichloroeliminans (strain LMG P-21439 / DCA1) TaxID=871963 RepID=L0F583_DESDL|nr:threonine ammonia-lyase IlvA [Desulfitobacterium dichloroeliminans]AGA68347.1 L-threonine ammonia-lyase [Desulfitobacterium dichloroeliminans LMG P-21439]